MEEAFEIIKHRGYEIRIYQDEDPQSPDEWDNEDVFLVNYHDDFDVRNDDIITKDDVRNWYQGEKIPQQKDYHIFMLSCLIHSGVWLSLNYNIEGDYYGGWDTSHIGVVLVSKKEARTKKKAKERAEGLVSDWNICLSGQVYGYQVEGIKGKDIIDSCWGFYGDEGIKQLTDEAKNNIDYYIDERLKKHKRKLKAEILNNVPLNNRVAFDN